jgi:L-iditol 2-dehydrogenase
VEVHASGICGTDIHTVQGLFPRPAPMVLGHEYSGVVRDVGRGVSHRLVGRSVACEPSYGCGRCDPCRLGRISQCPRCVRVGGFAERVALPAGCVHPLPRGLDMATASLAEPAACCLAGLEAFPMPRDATVLVIGGGLMGLLTMVLARRRGARRLILSDPVVERRRMARRLGAGTVVDPMREDLRARVMALTRERGADVVCEAVGKPELVAEAMGLARVTGVVNLVGVSPPGLSHPLDLFDAQYREVRIGGVFGRGTAFDRALALLPRLGVSRLVTASFPLERIGEAFAHAAAGRGIKTIIAPSTTGTRPGSPARGRAGLA